MDAVQEIKNRLSIVDVVSSYLPLKPAGRNFKGMCPFHDDHDPSLVVSPDREFAWCFACNNGGDIFAFVQKIENISFPEAMRLLAERANVQLPEFNPEKKEKKDRILEILKDAAEKYEHNFWVNKLAQEEVKKRQISDETLKTFKIGFAWKGDNEMEKYLLEKGYSRKELLDAGLSIPLDSKGEMLKDKFRSRIMFPFFDLRGNAVGFSGRAYGDFDPKYLNSPETEVYKKSEILFGLNFAKDHIKKEDFTLVTEGQFDCIACYDHGIKNVVAASGTAFSQAHTKQMLRFSQNIVFAMDADAAGIKATKRAMEIAISEGANVSVLQLPEGKDPDDLLREDKEKFLAALKNKKNAMDFFFDMAFKDRNPDSLKDKGEIFKDIFPVISKFSKKFEQDAFLVRLANLLEVDVNAIRADFRNFSKKGASYKPRNLASSNKKENDLKDNKGKMTKSEYLIGVLLAFPQYLDIVESNIIDSIFPQNQISDLIKKIKELKDEDNNLKMEEVLKDLSEEEKNKWSLITLYAEEKTENIPDTLREREFKKLISQINKQNFQETQAKLLSKMRNCGEDLAAQRDLFIQLNQLTTLAKSFK